MWRYARRIARSKQRLSRTLIKTYIMAERIVIKVGSNVLTRADGKLDVTTMSAIVDQVAWLRARGFEVIMVSSGAVASGRGELRTDRHMDQVAQRQLFSALGQVKLINLYYELFREYQLHVGQILTMKENFASRREYLNQRACLSVMLDNGVVPIINENDTVSVTELMFTDNDELSGLIATMMDAGWEDIFTARVSAVKNHGPWSERLSIDIYVRDREEAEPRKDVVRLMWANDDMMEDITGQLYDKGTVYLRWREVPKDEHNLPSDGDKVVILHRSDETLQAYLMMVLPEKCIYEVRPDILDDLSRKDDCGPYLLSLIKGPVEVEDMSSLQFEEMEVCVRQPEIVAPEDILEQLHLDKEN